MGLSAANGVISLHRQPSDDDREETAVQLAAPLPSERLPGPRHARQPGLLVVEGPETGRRYRLAGTMRIGRSSACDIVVCSQRISREHLALHRLPDGVIEVEDLGSSNGTFVNGRRIRRELVQPGDRITLGGSVTLAVTTLDPEEERAREAQMMEMLGRLGAGIAHDFNNLLGTVMATMEYLRGLPGHRTLDDSDVAECFEDINQAASHAAGMVGRLTSALRKSTEESDTVVDVRQLCTDMTRLLRRTLPRSIELVCNVEGDLRVQGDAAALQQLVLNLALNARDAMPNGGTLYLRASRADCHADSASIPEPLLVIEVEDTGVGMNAETRERALEPLFTTKMRGTGTGLGLATVADVARSHGGRVDIESEVGRGTLFRICLPAHEATPRRRSSTTLTESARTLPDDRRTLRVLIVDDEELVSRSTGRLLGHAGHEVMTVDTAAAAIELFRLGGPKPDVVLLDLDMPGMGGEECHARLADIDPDVRVVYLTGHWDSERERAGRARGGLAFLRKPCPRDKLVQTIERVARSPGTGVCPAAR